jgi:hypothetical protein
MGIQGIMPENPCATEQVGHLLEFRCGVCGHFALGAGGEASG